MVMVVVGRNPRKRAFALVFEGVVILLVVSDRNKQKKKGHTFVRPHRPAFGLRRDEECFIPPGHVNSSLRRNIEKPTQRGGLTLRVASKITQRGGDNPPHSKKGKPTQRGGLILLVASEMGKPTQRGGITPLVASKEGKPTERGESPRVEVKIKKTRAYLIRPPMFLAANVNDASCSCSSCRRGEGKGEGQGMQSCGQTVMGSKPSATTG